MFFLTGMSFSQWSLHNTGPWVSWQTPEAVGPSTALTALSFPVPIALSLGLVHECLGSSLHDGVLSDPVSPSIPTGSARGTVSFTLSSSLFPARFYFCLRLNRAPLHRSLSHCSVLRGL